MRKRQRGKHRTSRWANLRIYCRLYFEAGLCLELPNTPVGILTQSDSTHPSEVTSGGHGLLLMPAPCESARNMYTATSNAKKRLSCGQSLCQGYSTSARLRNQPNRAHPISTQATALTSPLVSRMTSSRSVRSLVKPAFEGSDASSSATFKIVFVLSRAAHEPGSNTAR